MKQIASWVLAMLIGLILAHHAAAQVPATVIPASVNLPEFPKQTGYGVVDAFPGQVEQVWATGMVVPPGETNRLFILNKAGLIWVITNLTSPNATVFLDLSAKTHWQDIETGLMGMAFHPGYRTNGTFFVYRSVMTEWAGVTGLHQRLARFSIDPLNPNRGLPDSEQPMITQRDYDTQHNAGDLAFGPDGYLYVAIGDGGITRAVTQQVDGDFFSGILRLDVDAQADNLVPTPHPAVAVGTYRIPRDNYWATAVSLSGQPIRQETRRGEFFAIGFRNPFRMSFAPDGVLWVNDVGLDRREEINRVFNGFNGGWIIFEGSLPWPYNVPAADYFQSAVFEYEHQADRRAITGGVWYHGSRYPELDGSYVFADFGGAIGSLRISSSGVPSVRWIAQQGSITDVLVHPITGEIMFSTLTGGDGKLKRLIIQDRPGPEIPARLSETGVFSSFDPLVPSNGVIGYELNQPFWSDHALKQRWFGLNRTNAPFGFRPQAPWVAPAGAFWVKHFELETTRGNPATRRRLETRILVRNVEGVWGATYRWRSDNSDADLVSADGADEIIMVKESATSVARPQHWRYPAREECLMCHTKSGGYAAGFNTAQLNRLVTRADGPTNQLSLLAAAGYLDTSIREPLVLPALASLDDERWSLTYRVKSYLEANCANCHRPEGPTRAFWNAQISSPLGHSAIVGELALNPLRDIFGLEPTYIVEPGSLSGSSIYQRISSLSSHRMPPLGSYEIQSNAVNLLGAWITNDLPRRQTYGQWVLRQFGTNGPAAVVGEQADPDRDGLSNETEYLLGELPTNGHVQWHPEVVQSGRNLTLRFARLANRRFSVEQTDDLLTANWRPLEVADNRWWVGQTDETAEIKLPDETQTMFLRVVVSEP